MRQVRCAGAVRECAGAVRGCAGAVLALLLIGGCDDRRRSASTAADPPKDAQHQGIQTPHGDHSPHHGGMVLMNGETHYEVVFDRNGVHRVWFSDAVREDLPASIGRDVRMTITRPNAPAEVLDLAIDDAGESWVARGKPVDGENVMVTLSYALRGAAHEIEIPFVMTPK